MSKQEKLISADKLMEWLSRKMWDREDKGNYYAYESVQDEIEAGTFNPDPVPTIKPGDRVKQTHWGYGIVNDIKDEKVTVFFDVQQFGSDPIEVSLDSLEVVKDE